MDMRSHKRLQQVKPIVVEVSRGCVTSVHSHDGRPVVVIDFDNTNPEDTVSELVIETYESLNSRSAEMVEDYLKRTELPE